jgi:hypothetical protein
LREKATSSLRFADDPKKLLPHGRGRCLIDVPHTCKNSGGVPAMRDFDLVRRKFGSEALRRHECCPSKFGPPERFLRHGFHD